MSLHAFTRAPGAFLALSPTQMSVGSMVLGLLALGALLFALQRLRVRHRSQLVVTTLFWREALEESRARTLFERFRHPLTYLLLALIGGLLWLSVARLESDRKEGVQHTFLLDGSARMAVGDRFGRAVDALAAELEDTPRERTEVLLCGDGVRTILAPGEDRALLAARLEGAKPVAAPSTVELTLASAAAQQRGGSGAPRRFVIVGDAPIGSSVSTTLDDGDWIERLPLEGPEQASAGNVGITALGVSPSASGTFDAVDVLIRVEGQGASAHQIAITLGGEPVTGAQRRGAPDGAIEYLIRDLRPATGAGVESRLLVVTLGTDGAANDLAMDDRAEVLLPELRMIRVLLTPSGIEAADVALRSACMADGAIEIVGGAARADIVIGGSVPEGVRALPSLRVTQASDQEHAFEVYDPAVEDANSLLAMALGNLALDRIDAARLASEIGRPLSLGAGSGASSGGVDQRSIAVWAELFDPTRSSFTESRAFPVVVGRAARWLSGTPEIIPYRASGRPQPVRLSGSVASAPYPWEASADPRAGAGLPGLLDPATTLGTGQPIPALDRSRDSDPATGGAGPWRFATWVLVLVLALLVFEWILYQRGRIA